MEIEVDSLEDMCALMCDNRIPGEEMTLTDYERIADNISTMIDQTGYTLDEIAEVVKEMQAYENRDQ